jgi:hypothetical protein
MSRVEYQWRPWRRCFRCGRRHPSDRAGGGRLGRVAGVRRSAIGAAVAPASPARQQRSRRHRVPCDAAAARPWPARPPLADSLPRPLRAQRRSAPTRPFEPIPALTTRRRVRAGASRPARVRRSLARGRAPARCGLRRRAAGGGRRGSTTACDRSMSSEAAARRASRSMPRLTVRQGARSVSVLVLSVKPLIGWGVGLVGGAGRVRADAQPYLGPRSGVAPERRHDG